MASIKQRINAFINPKQSAKSMTFTSLSDIKELIGKYNGFGSVGSTDLIKNFETIPDMFAITDFVTSQISNIPVKIVNSQGKDTVNKDLAELIRQPNYYQNWNELIKLFFSYYEVLGNSYLYAMFPLGIKKLDSLYVLPAPGITVQFEGKKELPNFMNTITGYKYKLNNKDYNFEASEILHKKYVNLRYENGMWAYGISKYIPADKITTDLKAIYDSRTSIIDSRGALGVLSNESEMPDAEESKTVKEKLNSSYGIKKGQDKFIVTTQKLSWQQIALGVAELQLIENAGYDFNKLCQLNGFDPVIFSTDGSTFANKREATKGFINSVLLPKVNDFYTDFNEWLSPYFKGDMIVPDWSKVKELREDNDLLSKRLSEQIRHGVVTPYNAHEQLYGQSENMPEDKYYIMKTIQNEEATNG